jgi:hypothetical protein
MKWLALAPVLVLALVVAALVARRRWNAASEAIVAKLRARVQPTAGSYDAALLADLPAPVQRYFRAALRDGLRIPRLAHLRQAGTFLLRPQPETWVPFTATQAMRARPAGFVWLAAMRVAPGIDVFVRDAFLDGGGSMRATVLGLRTMVDQSGTPAMARASLLRFLAEAAWMPTALLPSAELAWSPIDETRALATLTSDGITVSLEFRFGADGLIEGIRAERERDVDGTPVPMEWQGRWSAYEERDGMRVPLQGEVAWVTPDGHREPYWRGRVTGITFE